MNPAEKLVATYLRLNGFLLLTQFTSFGGDHHNHVDLLGLRAPGSVERVGSIEFPLDDALFAAIPDTENLSSRDTLLGLVVEVKTNQTIDTPDPAHIAYAAAFLGAARVVPASFSDSDEGPRWHRDGLRVGNRHALEWVVARIRWMDQNHRALTKSGSWPWSDDSLAELLVLYRYGAFRALGQQNAAGRQ